MSQFTYKLTKVRETKGAVLYQEVDSAGHPLDYKNDGSKVVSQYFRKNAFVGGIPSAVTVTVSY